MKQAFVYILANRRNGTLYTGVTRNLAQRMDEHAVEPESSFCKRYGLTLLVYYERHEDIYEAIRREKQIKRWRRSWKLKLVEDLNPLWEDLSGLL